MINREFHGFYLFMAMSEGVIGTGASPGGAEGGIALPLEIF